MPSAYLITIRLFCNKEVIFMGLVSFFVLVLLIIMFLCVFFCKEKPEGHLNEICEIWCPQNSISEIDHGSNVISKL